MAAPPLSREGALSETWRLSSAPMPATARRGTAMCNNRIRRPNVAPLRATAELTGVVTRYRGVRHKNDNNGNNHAVLVEPFQSRTLHELRQ